MEDSLKDSHEEDVVLPIDTFTFVGFVLAAILLYRFFTRYASLLLIWLVRKFVIRPRTATEIERRVEELKNRSGPALTRYGTPHIGFYPDLLPPTFQNFPLRWFRRTNTRKGLRMACHAFFPSHVSSASSAATLSKKKASADLLASTRGLVLLLPGLNEASTRGCHVAERLARAGFAVYAVDYLGYGDSEGYRGLVTCLRKRTQEIVNAVPEFRAHFEASCRQDTPQAAALAAERINLQNRSGKSNSNSSDGSTASVTTGLSAEAIHERVQALPFFLCGQSLGGAMSVRCALLGGPSVFAGAVLLAPALDSDVHPMLQKISGIAGRVIPRVPVAQLGDVDLGAKNLAVGADLLRDDSLYHGGIIGRTGAELVRGAAELRSRIREFRIPYLVMHGKRDLIVPPRCTELLVKNTPLVAKEDRKVIWFDEGWHDLIHDPEYKQVLEEIVSWLNQRLQKLK